MSAESRRKVLTILERHHHGRGRTGEMLDDEPIAAKLQVPIASVQDDLEALGALGHVQLAKTFGGMSALITARGRLALE